MKLLLPFVAALVFAVSQSRKIRVPICWLCLILAPLTGCREQEYQIRERGESISLAQEEKRSTELKVKDMERGLALLKQANREKQSHRNEFEAKAAKSAAAEKLTIQFRTDLEASLNRYAETVSTYRKNYLAP